MLTAKDFESILWQYVDIGDVKGLTNVAGAAEAIAQAAEQDRAELEKKLAECAKEGIQRGCRISELEAKVAVMGDLLRWADQLMMGFTREGRTRLHDEAQWDIQMHKALSAAPKVLYYKQDEAARVVRDLGLPGLPGIAPWERVQLTVTERLPKGEQATSSEQED
jgi:hypothetical protein